MRLAGNRFAVIGGAGFAGSRTVDRLLGEDVAEVVTHDDFCRGSHGNLQITVQDQRVTRVGQGRYCELSLDETSPKTTGSRTCLISRVIDLAAMVRLTHETGLSPRFTVSAFETSTPEPKFTGIMLLDLPKTKSRCPLLELKTVERRLPIWMGAYPSVDARFVERIAQNSKTLHVQ